MEMFRSSSQTLRSLFLEPHWSSALPYEGDGFAKDQGPFLLPFLLAISAGGSSREADSPWLGWLPQTVASCSYNVAFACRGTRCPTQQCDVTAGGGVRAKVIREKLSRLMSPFVSQPTDPGRGSRELAVYP